MGWGGGGGGGISALEYFITVPVVHRHTDSTVCME